MVSVGSSEQSSAKEGGDQMGGWATPTLYSPTATMAPLAALTTGLVIGSNITQRPMKILEDRGES